MKPLACVALLCCALFPAVRLAAVEIKIIVDGVERTVTAIDVGKVDKKPVLIPKSQKAPVYPVQLKAEGIKGEAVVNFVVGPSGEVVHTRVTKATRPEFGEAAAAAIRQWRFEPGVKNGEKVYTHLAVPISFGGP